MNTEAPPILTAQPAETKVSALKTFLGRVGPDDRNPERPLFGVELDLVTECSVPKRPVEIWESGLSRFKDSGAVQLIAQLRVQG